MRPVVFGDHDHAARVAVEPVDDARPRRPADAAQPVEMELQRAGQRARPMPFGGMDDHAGRLVDRGQPFVFVENLQRNVFRLGPLPRHLGQHDRDPLAGSPDAWLALVRKPFTLTQAALMTRRRCVRL